MKLPQPSRDENDTDREREKRSLAVLKEAHWRPAHAPGTFQATCERRPMGYGVCSGRFSPSPLNPTRLNKPLGYWGQTPVLSIFNAAI